MDGVVTSASRLRFCSEVLWEAIQDVQDGVLFFDASGRLLDWNLSAERIFDWSPPPQPGAHFESIFPVTFPPLTSPFAVPRSLSKTAELSPASFRLEGSRDAQNRPLVPTNGQGFWIVTPAGKRKWVEATFRQLDGGTSSPIWVASIRDRTWHLWLSDGWCGRHRVLGLVGKSRAMQEVFCLLERAANCDRPALIEGLPGTGKRLLARTLHLLRAGPDACLRFVSCRFTDPEALIGVLIGQSKGQEEFRADTKDDPPPLQLQTLVLEEVEYLPPIVQERLARLLEDQALSERSDGKIDGLRRRILATTCVSLPEKVSRGEFSRELFCQLRAIYFYLPPLSLRREDLPLLVDCFLRQLREPLHGPANDGLERVSGEALGALMDYPWPGNVQELKSALEFAHWKSGGAVIQRAHLPPEIERYCPQAGRDENAYRGKIDAVSAPGGAPMQLQADSSGAISRQVKARQLRQILAATSGNVAEAARRLGVSRTTIYKWMRQCQDHRPD